MRKELFAAGHVLSADPPIIYARPRPVPFGLAGLLAQWAPDQAFTAIIRSMWTQESEDSLGETVLFARAFRRRFPQLRIIVAGNTDREVELLRLNGVETVLANHNMFVDERVFRPLPDMTADFACIYNAKYSAFKRRELCAELESCAHIGYFSADPGKADQVVRYAAERKALPRHRFLNPVAGVAVKRLEPRQVNRALSRARVGLCLSAEEGPMVASMEYLMAGLPVVTTRSLGGRERYFTAETAIVADDNPRSIREAAEAMAARNIPRGFVRRTTLEIVRRDRAAFNAFIDGLREGRPAHSSDPRWTFDYTPNMFSWQRVADFAARLGLAGAAPDQPLSAASLLDEALTEDDLAPVRMG